MIENNRTENLMPEPRVSILASSYDDMFAKSRKCEQLEQEIYQLRKVVGRAIHQFQTGWSTNALEILIDSVNKS